MAIDWITTLQEQADFATQIAEDVNQTLDLPDLTPGQASRLYRTVEQGAQTFDRIIDEMEQHDLDVSLTAAAETIADVWTNLSVATANKVRVLQGLAPIEFPRSKDEA
ncbi:hypothetical protein [Phyllobacterium zundukense]|uniref:Uncharacterized protein n=1 Tax=Phyllobacterium zundukense TaxID=1867719 RepID=A0A2N9VQB8_9HYPH|nr:hypothetical protein [Phyllobacterium zundukense]ATU90708.1 hypothetical protein BLM14_02880 [Phyllobacterium zundukense]PIO41686.1 hypothetical protein B5P45_27440 [Phyllobacterium zundukense]